MNAPIDLQNEEAPGIPSASTAIGILFEKAADHLSDAELDWFSTSMVSHAVLELDHLSQTIEATGCLVSGCDSFYSGDFCSKTRLPTYLFSLANQLDTLVGFLRIGDEADFILKKKAEQAVKSQA